MSDIASAVTYAADHGARVANISLAGVSGSPSVNSAAQYARGKGTVVIASAGNCSCLESTPDSAYIINVSATDPADNFASFSSWGNHVDVSAPGVSIYTTTLGGLYMSMGGTSHAAPVVAGVVALMIAANPSLTASQVETLLEVNADDRGSGGWDQKFGWGRVNAYRAVAAAAASLPHDTTAPTVTITAPAAGAVVYGGVTVSVAASDNVGVSRVELYVDGALLATDTLAPYNIFWNTAAVVSGLHTLTARAVDAAGNVGSSSARTVDVENVPPAITTTSPLPVGTVATAYSKTLQASGGVAPYTWSRVSGSLPPGLGLSSAGVLSGTPSVAGTFVFRVRVTGTNSLYSEKDLSLTTIAEIIVDNAPAGVQDAPGGRTFTGSWCKSGAAGPYGVDSLYACGGSADTYRWTPTIPAARSYDVFVRWTANSTRATAVPFTVNHVGGQTTRTFNEQTSGSQWVLHGRYSFNAGTAGYVQTSDSGGPCNADAVRFVPVP